MVLASVLVIQQTKVVRPKCEEKMSLPVAHLNFAIPKRFEGKTKSVWNEYAQLHAEYKPLSLGHGFSDYVVTKYFNDVLAEVAANADNSMTQYARAFVRHIFAVKFSFIAVSIDFILQFVI